MPRRSEFRPHPGAFGTAAAPEDAEVLATSDIQHPNIAALLSPDLDRNARIHALLAASEYVFCLVGTECPKTYRQARNSPDWEMWYKAILEELAKMKAYDVYQVVLRDDNMRILSARWVFTRKMDGDTGKAAAYKARWVARGYTQVEGLDFNEIFACVAHKDTIRIFLAVVNYFKLLCDQVDIVAAFLNGELAETIHLEAPEGSDIPPTHVLKLKKSLYGLKQSPGCFNDKLDARGFGIVLETFPGL
jgi:hypothetical protein